MKVIVFINLEKIPKFMQMEGLETTFLTGLHGENMMIPFNTTLPGLYFYK